MTSAGVVPAGPLYLYMSLSLAYLTRSETSPLTDHKGLAVSTTAAPPRKPRNRGTRYSEIGTVVHILHCPLIRIGWVVLHGAISPISPNQAVFSKTILHKTPDRIACIGACMHACTRSCAKRRAQNDALQGLVLIEPTRSSCSPRPQLQTCSHSWRRCASDSRPCRRISVRLRARRTSLTRAHAADTEHSANAHATNTAEEPTHHAHIRTDRSHTMRNPRRSVLTPCATHGDPC
jgi:hypothetical protein